MWPRHLRVLFALNINFWAFRFEAKLEFLCLLCSSLSGFWSRALKIIHVYSERSSVFKLILKFGNVWFVFKSISQKCLLAGKVEDVAIDVTGAMLVTGTCCTSVACRLIVVILVQFYPVHQQFPSFFTETWIGETLETGRFDWRVFGRWLDGFDFCVVSVPNLTRSPMRTGPLWSCKCFTMFHIHQWLTKFLTKFTKFTMVTMELSILHVVKVDVRMWAWHHEAVR